jgi:Bacterial Ig domain
MTRIMKNNGMTFYLSLDRRLTKALCYFGAKSLATFATSAGVMLCTPEEANAQVTYSYAGNPFNSSQCLSYYPPGSAQTAQCIAGNITATVTFDIPSGYTGYALNRAGVTEFNIFVNGPNVAFNSLDPKVKLNVSNFVFRNGSIISAEIGAGFLKSDMTGAEYTAYTENDTDPPADGAELPGAVPGDALVGVVFGNPGTWSVVSTPTPPPVSVDEAKTTPINTPVKIDLSAGATGNPVSAALVNTPIGGTVTGFPSTIVTFTPTLGFTGPASFEFDLSNAGGVSNIATGGIAVLPSTQTLLSPGTKQVLLQIGLSSKNVSDKLEYAAMVAEGPKNLLKNVQATIAQQIFVDAVAGDDQLSSQTGDFMLNSIRFSASSLGRLTKTNAISIPLEVDSLIFELVSLGTTVLASDPPDPNYKVRVFPQYLTFSSTGDATVDQITNDYLSYAEMTAASIHAVEKWQGAMMAHNWPFEQIHRFEFIRYSNAATAAKSVLQADAQALATRLPPVGIDSFDGGATAIAATFNAQCGQPLPPDANQQLLSLPLTQAQIDQAICDYVSTVTPDTISTDFNGALHLLNLNL